MVTLLRSIFHLQNTKLAQELDIARYRTAIAILTLSKARDRTWLALDRLD